MSHVNIEAKLRKYAHMNNAALTASIEAKQDIASQLIDRKEYSAAEVLIEKSDDMIAVLHERKWLLEQHSNRNTFAIST